MVGTGLQDKILCNDVVMVLWTDVVLYSFRAVIPSWLVETLEVLVDR